MKIEKLLTTVERTHRAIERCEQKRDAATDAESKRYYELCLVGWRQELARAQEEGAGVTSSPHN